MLNTAFYFIAIPDALASAPDAALALSLYGDTAQVSQLVVDGGSVHVQTADSKFEGFDSTIHVSASRQKITTG